MSACAIAVKRQIAVCFYLIKIDVKIVGVIQLYEFVFAVAR